MSCRRLTIVIALWPAIAHAAPTPWTFDFDPNIAADPGHVNANLQDLQQDLPGLPSTGIVELTTGQVDLYFFDDVVDALLRARSSGPAISPPVTRTPTFCLLHDSFVPPSLSASGQCIAIEQDLLSSFEPDLLKTCFHVEFPETYVYEHSPIGHVDLDMVSTFTSLISFAGEALTHVPDYKDGLLPPDFYPLARDVIAKLRYQDLKDELSERTTAYLAAKTQLQNNASCFDAGALGAFVSTIDGLVAELGAVETELDQLYNTGVAQAIADRQALRGQGRIRADLPYPSLTDRERELLAFYIGGLYWRMRGAGLVALPEDPGQGLLRRFLYVQSPYQLIGDLAGGIIDAEDVGRSIFIQETWGYAEWFDMGTDPGSNDKYSDLVQMTNRGKRATLIVAPQLENRGFDVKHLVAGGLMMGPCYYYIWEELSTFRLGANLQDPYMQFLEWPTASGEFCTGAALALGLTRTLLWGKDGGPCTPDCSGGCGTADGCGAQCAPCADAGTVEPDAGPELDAGTAEPDAEVVADAEVRPDAMSTIDSGETTFEDASMPVLDAGVIEKDAGATNAATPVEEAGCSCETKRDRVAGSDWLFGFVSLLLLALRGRP